MPEDSRPRIGEDDGRVALLVDGVVQSVKADSGEVAGYWVALLPSVRPRLVLVLGLGGGTIVHLLRRRFGEVRVIGVEVDPAIAVLAREAFGLDRREVDIVVDDAFRYVETCRERFDYVCIDLFRGGVLERGVLARPFLRRIRELATPGAEVVLNLFADRRSAAHLHRISRVLTVRSVERVGKNLVVRAGLRGGRGPS